MKAEVGPKDIEIAGVDLADDEHMMVTGTHDPGVATRSVGQGRIWRAIGASAWVEHVVRACRRGLVVLACEATDGR